MFTFVTVATSTRGRTALVCSHVRLKLLEELHLNHRSLVNPALGISLIGVRTRLAVRLMVVSASNS
jgi:hypothetical protein